MRAGRWKLVIDPVSRLKIARHFRYRHDRLILGDEDLFQGRCLVMHGMVQPIGRHVAGIVDRAHPNRNPPPCCSNKVEIAEPLPL